MTSSKATTARLACLVSGTLLVLLYAIKTLVLWPTAIDTRVIIFVIQVLPFVALLPGIIKSHWRSYAWLCFILLLYFMNATLALFSPGRLIVDWFIMAAVISVFMAAMLYVRWRRVELAGS